MDYVLAMSTTNQDVGQLRQTGLEATTIPIRPLALVGARPVIISTSSPNIPTRSNVSRAW